MTTFAYLSAADWGMWWDTANPRPERQPDPECYIHHVGGAAYMDGDAAAIFRELNAYAIDVKGYDAVDYDLLVHYDRTRDILTTGEGRGEFMSAATRNRNEEGEAVVLCGNTHIRMPHPAELEGLARAHVIGIEHGWIARTALILGHRDNLAYPGGQPTACPGQHLYAELPTVRTRVVELLAPPNPPEVKVIYLARARDNQYHYRRGDGSTATILRSREYVRLKDDFPADHYVNPVTRKPIGSFAAVPALDETALDLLVGYPDLAVYDDDEG